MLATTDPPERTLIDALLAEQHNLSAVGRFSFWQQSPGRSSAPALESHYRRLLPATPPAVGQQYAFEVDLDKCSGCKACVTACHSLNGLDEDETWRSVGLLISPAATDPTSRVTRHASRVQHVTTACHHCADPGCLNGCPVLAYDKDPVTGIVRHLDDQCIGCSYCVMKCPYEVPQYSPRLGIVRKCDMCHQRLAVGEAPACVQACPNEAIRITLVGHEKLLSDYRGKKSETRNPKFECSPKPEARNSDFVIRASFDIRHSTFGFLPDAPDPATTLPTTRYVTKHPRLDLIAADHAALRLDQAHWPLIVMLLLTQTAAGMFLAAAVAQLVGIGVVIKPLTVVGFAMLVVGLTASILHLGQPLKAWRAFLGWRKSWLSREIITFNTFAGVALLAILHPPSSILVAFVGLAAVFVSAMVYVDTKRPLWSAPFTFTNFFGTTLLLGATFAAVVCGFTGAPAVARQSALGAALLIFTALFVWRRLHWRAALRNPASPIHFNARVVRGLLPRTLPAHARLFALTIAFGLLALANVGNATPWWVSLAALAAFSSEILGRYLFFAASASKRMPGGIAA